MYEQKTKENDSDVMGFISEIQDEKKQKDTLLLLEIFKEATGLIPKMWGKDIIGFGNYHYKYASGHQGDSMLVGFSPRKNNFSIYLATGDAKRQELLDKLGRHKQGAACVYIDRVKDIDTDILKKLLIQSVEFLKETYPDTTR